MFVTFVTNRERRLAKISKKKKSLYSVFLLFRLSQFCCNGGAVDFDTSYLILVISPKTLATAGQFSFLRETLNGSSVLAS